jgi:hypothetical protein
MRQPFSEASGDTIRLFVTWTVSKVADFGPNAGVMKRPATPPNRPKVNGNTMDHSICLKFITNNLVEADKRTAIVEAAFYQIYWNPPRPVWAV